jgi:hypothetical protein
MLIKNEKQDILDNFDPHFIETFPAWALLDFWENYGCSGSEKVQCVLCHFTCSQGKSQLFEICNDLNKDGRIDISDLENWDKHWSISDFLELFRESTPVPLCEIDIDC